MRVIVKTLPFFTISMLSSWAPMSSATNFRTASMDTVFSGTFVLASTLQLAININERNAMNEVA